VGLAEPPDGSAWLLQKNDLLGNEKLKLCGGVEWSLRLPVRDGFESLEGRSVQVGEEAGCDLVRLASLAG